MKAPLKVQTTKVVTNKTFYIQIHRDNIQTVKKESKMNMLFSGTSWTSVIKIYRFLCYSSHFILGCILKISCLITNWKYLKIYWNTKRNYLGFFWKWKYILWNALSLWCGLSTEATFLWSLTLGTNKSSLKQHKLCSRFQPPKFVNIKSCHIKNFKAAWPYLFSTTPSSFWAELCWKCWWMKTCMCFYVTL